MRTTEGGGAKGSKMSRRVRMEPDIDHITGLFDNPSLAAYFQGHLVVEAILVKLISSKLEVPEVFNSYDNLRFPGKVDLCGALGLLDDAMMSFLKHMNRVRNKFAHNLGFTLTIDDAFDLARRAAAAGVEFSDDRIHTDLDIAVQEYGVEAVIQEVFQNLSQDIIYACDPNLDLFSAFFSSRDHLNFED